MKWLISCKILYWHIIPQQKNNAFKDIVGGLVNDYLSCAVPSHYLTQHWQLSQLLNCAEMASNSRNPKIEYKHTLNDIKFICFISFVVSAFQ